MGIKEAPNPPQGRWGFHVYEKRGTQQPYQVNSGYGTMTAAAGIWGFGSQKRRPVMCCAATETSSDHEVVDRRNRGFGSGRTQKHVLQSGLPRPNEKVAENVQASGKQDKERNLSSYGLFSFFSKRKRRKEAVHALKEAIRIKDVKKLESALEECEALCADSGCISKGRTLLLLLQASPIVREKVGALSVDNKSPKGKHGEHHTETTSAKANIGKPTDQADRNDDCADAVLTGGWMEKVRKAARSTDSGMNSGGLVSDNGTGRRTNQPPLQQPEEMLEGERSSISSGSGTVVRGATTAEKQGESQQAQRLRNEGESRCSAELPTATAGPMDNDSCGRWEGLERAELKPRDETGTPRLGSNPQFALQVSAFLSGRAVTASSSPLLIPESDVKEQGDDCLAATFATSPSVKDRASVREQDSYLENPCCQPPPDGASPLLAGEETVGSGPASDSESCRSASSASSSPTDKDEMRMEPEMWKRHSAKESSSQRGFTECERQLDALENARATCVGLSDAMTAQDVARVEEELADATKTVSLASGEEEAELSLTKEQEVKAGMDEMGTWIVSKDVLETALRDAEKLGCLNEKWVQQVKEALEGSSDQEAYSEGYGKWLGKDRAAGDAEQGSPIDEVEDDDDEDDDDDDEVMSKLTITCPEAVEGGGGVGGPGGEAVSKKTGNPKRRRTKCKQPASSGMEESNFYFNKNQQICLACSNVSTRTSASSFPDSETGSPCPRKTSAVVGESLGSPAISSCVSLSQGQDSIVQYGWTRREARPDISGSKDNTGNSKVQLLDNMVQGGEEVEEEWGEVGEEGERVQRRFSLVVADKLEDTKDSKLSGEGLEEKEGRKAVDKQQEGEREKKTSQSDDDGPLGQHHSDLAWPLRFLQQAMTDQNLQSLELGVREAEHHGQSNSGICQAAGAMISRLREEQEVRLRLEGALGSGEVGMLEEAVQAVKELGLEDHAFGEAKGCLQACGEDNQMSDRLKEAIKAGHFIALQEAISAARCCSVDGKVLKDAEALLLELLKAREEMLVLADKGLAEKDCATLVQALYFAEKIGLESLPVIKEAMKEKEKMEKEEDAAMQIEHTIHNRDLTALRMALLTCTELGLQGTELAEGRRVLSCLEREKESTDQLEEATKGGDVAVLIASIEKAERACIPKETLDMAFARLAELKEGRMREENARNELRTAIAEREMTKLELCLALAKEVSIDSGFISEAEGLLQILRKEEEVRAVIREAIQRRSVGELEKAVAEADALSLADGLVDAAKRELKRAQEEAEVKMMMANAISMKDIRELKLAIGQSDKLDLTGPTIDEGKRMLQVLVDTEETLVIKAMEDGRLEVIEAALKSAEEKGVDSGMALSEAKRMLSRARDEKLVLDMVNHILAMEDEVVKVHVIEEAVAASRRLGVQGPTIDSLVKKLQAVKAREGVVSDLRKGVLDRNLQLLDSALSRASSLRLKGAEVAEAQVLVEGAQEKKELIKRLRMSIELQDLERLDDVLAGARKKVREWIREEDQAMEAEAGMLGDLLQEAGLVAQKLRPIKVVCARIRELTDSSYNGTTGGTKRDIGSLQKAVAELEKVGGEKEPAYTEGKMLIERWTRERKVLDKVRMAVDSSNSLELAAAVLEAELIGLDGEDIVKRGRSCLESLKKKGDVKVKLRLATALRDSKALETAITMAVGMDLGHSKEVLKAKEVLAKVEEEKEVVASMKTAMSNGNLEALEAAWECARKLGIDDQTVQGAKNMLEKKWALRAAECQLLDALEKRDLKALGVALTVAAGEGVDPKMLADAESMARRLEMEKEIKVEIISGVEEERWEDVAKAVERAEDLGWDDEHVKAARKLVEEVQSRNEAVVKMKDAAERRNLEDLTVALELARRLGVEEEETEGVKKVLEQLCEEDRIIKEITIAVGRRDLARLEMAVKGVESMKTLVQNELVREGLVVLGQLKEQKSLFEEIREAIRNRSLRRLEAAVRKAEELKGFESNFTVVEAKKVIGQLHAERAAMDKVKEALTRKDVRRLGEAVREVEWLVDRREWDPIVERGRRAYQDIVKIWSELESAIRNRDVHLLKKSLERWDWGIYSDWEDRRVEEGRELLGKLEVAEMMLDRGTWSRDIEALRKGLKMATDMRLRNLKVKRAESALSKLRAWRAAAVIAQYGAATRSIDVLEMGLRLGDIAGLDMREVSRERQELERMKLERDVVTAILKAMEAGDMDSLDRVVKMADEMELDAKEPKEAKQVLEVARARGSALLALRDALSVRDVERIQRAIEEAELMRIEDEILLYAKVMVVQLTAEAHAIALLEDGTRIEDVMVLEEGLGLAERLKMSDPRVERARKFLTKVRPKWEVGLRLREAMDARNDAALEGALGEAAVLGVDRQLICEANTVLCQLRLERAAIARLTIAVQLGDRDEVAIAVEAAEKLQLQGDVLEEGRSLLEGMDKEGYVISRLQQGIERKELPLLELGIRMAAKYGMSGDLVEEAKSSVEEVKEWAEMIQDLRAAMRDRDIARLEVLLAAANQKEAAKSPSGRGSGTGFSISLSFNYKTEVVAEAEKILEQLVAEERIRDAIFNERIGELEFALAAADKVELTGDLVERGRCVLQLKRAMELRDGPTLAAAIDAASRLDLGKEYMSEGRTILDQLREELRDMAGTARIMMGGGDKEAAHQKMQAEMGELLMDEVARSLDLKSIASDLRLGAVNDAIATAANPRWRIDKYWNLRSPDAFTKTATRSRYESACSYDASAIPLLKLPKKVGEAALICHKRLLQVCGDKPSRASLGVTARGLLAAGNQTPELRDEIYLQICRHLITNTNRKSEKKGWLILCLCTDTFESSGDLLIYLLNFCGQYWDEKRNMKMARYCFVKFGESLHPKEDLHTSSSTQRLAERKLIMSADDITDFLTGSANPWSEFGSVTSSHLSGSSHVSTSSHFSAR